MRQNNNFHKLLVASNLLILSFIVFIFLNGFREKDDHPKFTEIDAERINIVGQNGKPVLVLSNRNHIPGPSMNGKTYSPDVIDGRNTLLACFFLTSRETRSAD